MNLNKALLIGRLTGDPQLRQTQSGQSVTTFSIATNRTWLDKAGQKQVDVQYHNIVVWGRQAEIVNQFLKKGALVYIEGRIQTRSYQDSRGETKRVTEIVSERVQFGPRSAGAAPVSGGINQTAEHEAGEVHGASESHDKADVLPDIILDEGEGELKAEDIPF